MKKTIKLLCLLLTLTILTGSLWVSAETTNPEYETAMQNNIESAISDIFGEATDDNSDNSLGQIEIGSSNEGTASPLWGSGSHESTVTTSYGTNLTAFMKTMCMVPDDSSVTLTASLSKSNYLGLTSSSTIALSNGSTFTMTEDYDLKYRAILHGRGNYVASLRFLYTVARNLVNNTYSGTNVSKVQQAIKASLGSTDVANNTFYGESKTYSNPTINWVSDSSSTYPYIGSITAKNSFTSLGQRLALEKAIYIVANTWFTGQNDAYNELLNSGKYSNVVSSKDFQIKTALKIIGIATHLCGDLYAHKTVVPTNVTFTASTVPTSRNNATIYRGTSGLDFNGSGRWSAKHGIKTLVAAGSTITTQQITQWQLSGSTTGYPDSVYFYNERLSIASKQLVANMYDNFFNGTSLGNTGFYVNWFLHTNYTLRLANLKLYTYSIGSQPTIADRLTRLSNLDSAVAMSDVVPSGGYKTPDATTNTWKKGYTASY